MSELKDVSASRDPTFVIPAKAEALYNSEAGQSSLNTSCEARKTFISCAAHVIFHWIPAFAHCCPGKISPLWREPLQGLVCRGKTPSANS